MKILRKSRARAKKHKKLLEDFEKGKFLQVDNNINNKEYFQNIEYYDNNIKEE